MSDFNKLISFIRDTFGEMDARINLHESLFIGNEKQYLLDAIDSNFVSSVGAYVGKFEQMCADYTGAKYAIAAVNGTSALHIALLLAGVDRGDEVITQPLTFIATANAISYTGAEPVFLDVDRDTLGLSPKAVKNWLEHNVEIRRQHHQDGTAVFSSYNIRTQKRIAACVPMHTFGHPIHLDELKEVLDDYHIPLVEDAAESIGSYYKGKHTGTTGLLGILSFNGNKLITTGGGGMILTNDEDLAGKAKHITTQAKIPHAWEFRHDMTGYNYRLTNLAAALGCAQIEQLDYLLTLKRKLASDYQQFFEGSDLTFVIEPENCRSNYWLNAVITRDRRQRDELLEFTNNHGVMTRPIWELMNRLPMFAHCETDSLENAIWLADRVVNLPSSAIVPGYRK